MDEQEPRFVKNLIVRIGHPEQVALDLLCSAKDETPSQVVRCVLREAAQRVAQDAAAANDIHGGSTVE